MRPGRRPGGSAAVDAPCWLTGSRACAPRLPPVGGSSVLAHRVRRSLQVCPEGVSRLLRCGQGGRCRDRGNRIEWYHRNTERAVRLHPQELPATRVAR
ncbi:DUF6083 domain-containing protein [Streptomyces sp. Ag109_O5-10]|uniref:DUF6083 domain-containing protein n=1 Tax=Streptomyces sp. Ag109_O5-10 TaxID=1855349 RepID=UPI002108927D|nr:DUF6083 domain-containing protein [Streptomyces sp. Ag109_O5-10]